MSRAPLPPGFAADLDLVVGHYRHERLRNLCDPTSATYSGRAVARVVAAAARLRGEPAPGIAVAPQLDPPLPSLGRQFAGLLESAGRAVAASARGEPVLAPQAVQDARLAVCRDGLGLDSAQLRDGRCDRYRPSDGRCSACGCRLAGVAGKASLATERCPLGRWPAGRRHETGDTRHERGP